MSIQDTIGFDKSGEPVRHSLFKKLFLSLVILLVALLGFGIGRLTAGGERGKVEIKMTNDQGQMTNDASGPLGISHSEIGASGDGVVYASSKGTRYYYPGCKSTVSDANKVTFATAAMAEAAGYVLASGCRK